MASHHEFTKTPGDFQSTVFHSILSKQTSNCYHLVFPNVSMEELLWSCYRVRCQPFCSIFNILLSVENVTSIYFGLKPMSDLCWQCQRNNTAILRAANHPDTEKSVILKAAENHLKKVQLERSFYKPCCDNCRKEVQRLFTVGESFSLLALTTLSRFTSLVTHCSLGYISFWHHANVVFLEFCVKLFQGRLISSQTKLWIVEKGPLVLSQLHYFFENFGLGEKEIFLTADNCCGLKKNNYMLQYLKWRCTTGLHTKITLSFLVVGHTKFFGLLKRKFWNTKVSSLAEISAVNESAYCNHSQLVTMKQEKLLYPH